MIKRKRKLTIAESTAILTGRSATEPEITQENYKSDLLRAFNWYGGRWDDKQSYKVMVEYLKTSKMKDYLSAVAKATTHDIRVPSMIARLIMREQYVELQHVEWLFRRLAELKERYTPVVSDTPLETKQVVSIQDRISENANMYGAQVDKEIDDFILNKCKSDFSMQSFLTANTVSGVVAKKIAELYQPILNELNEAVNGTDPQLKEGYAFLGKRNLTKYRDFIQSIVNDCSQQVVSAKAQRKPRTRKVKPPHVVVKNVKVMKEYAELNLKSLPPEKIIGAEELWVYIPEKRKLIVYYAANGEPLGVKGKSITNYDVNESGVKTIRKPEEFFKGLNSTGKRAMANAWKNVKGKASKPRGRMNDTMLILAVN